MIMKYFTHEEFCKSNWALQNKVVNVYPDLETMENVERLVDMVLDPLRMYMNMPVRITSGYRNQQVNEAAGGVSWSQHTKGMAADFIVGGSEQLKVAFEYIRNMLDFDQLIAYTDKQRNNWSWIHVSYINPLDNRKQVFFKIA